MNYKILDTIQKRFPNAKSGKLETMDNIITTLICPKYFSKDEFIELKIFKLYFFLFYPFHKNAKIKKYVYL